MKLYIGNKTYSSWSMRPWVLMRALAIDFDEVWVPFDGFTPDAEFKKTMAAIHPLATVPVLEEEGVIIADSLAIIEYLAEAYPEKKVWPQNAQDRNVARQLTAIMHSGFQAIRGHCPMNIGAELPEVGARLMKEHPALRVELDLMEAILKPQIKDQDFLFGEFSAVDAFYAPVMSRIKTYNLMVSDKMQSYQKRVLSHPAVADWCKKALAEDIFLDFEEPYRQNPNGNNA